MSNKIFETDSLTAWRGLDDNMIVNMVKSIENKILFCIYATREEFTSFNYDFPESNYLALYEHQMILLYTY